MGLLLPFAPRHYYIYVPGNTVPAKVCLTTPFTWQYHRVATL